MNTLKQNGLPLICCLVYAIDCIGHPMTILSGIALGLTILYLVILTVNILRERRDRT